MSSKIKKEDAEYLVYGWVKRIEEEKGKISKNFDDMDLKNADVQERYRERIESIKRKCDELIAAIKAYNFI